MALLASVGVAAFTIAPEPVAAPPDMAAQRLVLAEPIERVTPSMAVRLGPSGANVVDLAVGSDALYTLDVAEGSVRAFTLEALDQQPLPSTLVARTGTPIDVAGHRLAVPVAIEYLADAQPDQAGLAIVDQSRTVVQVGKDRGLKVRTVPASASWQTLGALGSDSAGRLFFMDSGAHRLLEYQPLGQRVSAPPTPVLDSTIWRSNTPRRSSASPTRSCCVWTTARCNASTVVAPLWPSCRARPTPDLSRRDQSPQIAPAACMSRIRRTLASFRQVSTVASRASCGIPRWAACA